MKETGSWVALIVGIILGFALGSAITYVVLIKSGKVTAKAYANKEIWKMFEDKEGKIIVEVKRRVRKVE